MNLEGYMFLPNSIIYIYTKRGLNDNLDGRERNGNRPFTLLKENPKAYMSWTRHSWHDSPQIFNNAYFDQHRCWQIKLKKHNTNYTNMKKQNVLTKQVRK